MKGVVRMSGKTMKRKSLSSAKNWALACLLALPAPALAKGSGTTAAEFLKIGVGARALGLAGAYTALSNDPHAMYWNPSSLALLDRPQLASSYNLLYQDTSQGFMSYAHPSPMGTWGLGVNYLQVADIEKRAGDTAAADSTFAAKDSAVYLAYARPKVGGNLSLGANAKLIQLNLDGTKASAFALDLGAFYQCESLPLNLGLSVLNAGTSAKFNTEGDPLPLGVKLGGAYRLLGGKLVAASGLDTWVQSQRMFGALGLEYRPIAFLAVRGGYRFGQGQDNLGSGLVGAAGGVGFRFKMLDVDYAYVPFGDLGNTHRMSLKVTF